VGLPGQTLQIKNRIVYLNGKANKEPDNVQYTYYVKLKQPLPTELTDELGISNEDMASLSQYGYLPLTKKAVMALAKAKDSWQALSSTPMHKRAIYIHLMAIRVGQEIIMVRYGYRKKVSQWN